MLHLGVVMLRKLITEPNAISEQRSSRCRRCLLASASHQPCTALVQDAIAQLEERQTEDPKVPSLGPGTRQCIDAIALSISASYACDTKHAQPSATRRGTLHISRKKLDLVARRKRRHVWSSVKLHHCHRCDPSLTSGGCNGAFFQNMGRGGGERERESVCV